MIASFGTVPDRQALVQRAEAILLLRRRVRHRCRQDIPEDRRLRARSCGEEAEGGGQADRFFRSHPPSSEDHSCLVASCAPSRIAWNFAHTTVGCTSVL